MTPEDIRLFRSQDMEESKWYKAWFNSPYYHILYKNRDQREAEQFLDNLVSFLHLPPHASILDIACGRGRHAIYLSKKKFEVTGFDLSPENISYDKKFENETLHFYLHDMREIFRVNYFDVVLNLFSSFGYFDREEENIRCLWSAALAMKKNGIFVFDYFNASKIRLVGNMEFEKNVDNIHFHICKKIDKKIVRKEIQFTDEGREYLFEEKVLLLTITELENYFRKAGLTLLHKFGNYQLDPFNESESERIILVATKK